MVYNLMDRGYLPYASRLMGVMLVYCHHRNTQIIAMLIGRWHQLQFVRQGYSLIATGCHRL